MKNTTRALLAFFLLCIGAQAVRAQNAAPSEDIFIEGESSPRHNWSAIDSHPANLVSGDRVLRLSNPAPPIGEGYVADFPFTLQSGGTRHIWAAVSLPVYTSTFWWRVDGGAWQHETELSDNDDYPTRYGVSGVMGWLRLGTPNLAAGNHTLQIRVDEHRRVPDFSHYLYLDAILITPRNVFPRGLVRASDVASLRERAIPQAVPRAGKTGAPLVMGANVEEADKSNRQLRALGFSYLQSDSDHLEANQKAPGVWDWKDYDRGLALAQRAGVGWQPFPHLAWAPPWYRETSRFVPSTGLKTKRRINIISVWSPDIVRWYDENYAAMAARYGDKIGAIFLGVHGDFGEPIFPMGFHPDEIRRFGEEGAGAYDFWCGDPFARQDFRAKMLKKYGSLKAINAAWNSEYSRLQNLDYPPQAYDIKTPIASTRASRRRWLDFLDWYFGGMTHLASETARIARKHFPKARLQLPIGGGSEQVMHGQDVSALAKMTARYGVDVRSTHGGFEPFEWNSASMMSRTATAAQVYHRPHWLEPFGPVTPQVEVARVMENLSSGNAGYWTWSMNPVNHPDVFREYKNFYTQEKPVVDVALFFPTTSHRLNPSVPFPIQLKTMGAVMRDVLHHGMVDEPLIADGALNRFRVLMWLEGDVIEKATLEKMRRWIQSGGTLLKFSAAPPQTVEGDTKLGAALLGVASSAPNISVTNATPPLRVLAPSFSRHLATFGGRGAMPLPKTNPNLLPATRVLARAGNAPLLWESKIGRGRVLVWNGEDDDALRGAFYEVARDATYNLSKLDKSARDAREIDAGWDGVYTTLLANGEAILFNAQSTEKRVSVGRKTVALPPVSVRSALVGSR